MPTLLSIVGNQNRPASVARIIGEKPSEITILRLNGDVLEPQTVRLDMLSAPTEAQYANNWARVASQKLLLTGYKGHPTIPDTDIQAGDSFVYVDDDQRYEVRKVESQFRDRTLALVEAVDGI